MLALKLNHVSKRGPWSPHLLPKCQQLWSMSRWCLCSCLWSNDPSFCRSSLILLLTILIYFSFPSLRMYQRRRGALNRYWRPTMNMNITFDAMYATFKMKCSRSTPVHLWSTHILPLPAFCGHQLYMDMKRLGKFHKKRNCLILLAHPRNHITFKTKLGDGLLWEVPQWCKWNRRGFIILFHNSIIGEHLILRRNDETAYWAFYHV